MIEIDIAPPRYPEEWVPAEIVAIDGFEHFKNFGFARKVHAQISGQAQQWDRLDLDRIRVTP